MYSASEVEKMFKSRLAEEENKWREEGDHQPQKKTMLENVRSQVLR
jgi:hypothetical protein